MGCGASTQDFIPTSQSPQHGALDQQPAETMQSPALQLVIQPAVEVSCSRFLPPITRIGQSSTRSPTKTQQKSGKWSKDCDEFNCWQEEDIVQERLFLKQPSFKSSSSLSPSIGCVHSDKLVSNDKLIDLNGSLGSDCGYREGPEINLLDRNSGGTPPKDCDANSSNRIKDLSAQTIAFSADNVDRREDKKRTFKLHLYDSRRCVNNKEIKCDVPKRESRSDDELDQESRDAYHSVISIEKRQAFREGDSICNQSSIYHSPEDYDDRLKKMKTILSGSVKRRNINLIKTRPSKFKDNGIKD